MENRILNIKDNLKSFKECFKDFTDCYTVIGGTACFLLMEEAGLDFRLTKDIDMILILEDRKKEFTKTFWDYIISGHYTCGWKEKEVHYYRFTNPLPSYPSQIELFSKNENFAVDQRIVPIHIGEDISSLSAIALDEDFYNFMMEGRKVIDGVCVLNAEHIIPFKMFAWLNNKKEKEEGKNIGTKDISKHKNDIFRLYQLLNLDIKVKTFGNVKKAVSLFIEKMYTENVDQTIIGKNKKEEILNSLKKIYLD